MLIGILVLLVALLFWRVTLPEVKEESQKPADDTSKKIPGAETFDHAVSDYDVSWKKLFRHRHFILAVLAQFFYVAAQTGVNSFFINYVTEEMPAISNQAASRILAFGGMGLFWLGRFTGSTVFMRLAKPNRLLAIYALMNVITMIIVMSGLGWFSVVALFSTYFFMSIMFPTIFALGIKDLGPLTKKASSLLVMAIVGGALIPMLMGHIADISTMATGFAVPLVCFVFILYFGLYGYKVRKL